MSPRTPGTVWQKADVVAGFIEDRRKLIPLFDVQEGLARRLIARGGREIMRFLDLGAGDGGFAELVINDSDILSRALRRRDALIALGGLGLGAFLQPRRTTASASCAGTSEAAATGGSCSTRSIRAGTGSVRRIST
jgi:hypothetical protein